MRKLNRKGFTLVELLAVIVILAIVVGITLVTVLPTLQKSRQEAFELTANTAADFLEKQYQLYLVGNEYGDAADIDFTTTNMLLKTATPGTDGATISDADYAAAGLKANNYYQGLWYINENTGRACVYLVAATRTLEPTGDGEYYDAGTAEGTYNNVYSTGCGTSASANVTKTS